MYTVANAFAKNGVIHAVILGQLPDPCDEAKIVDQYPGGNIIYVKDPGTAQIFIKESRKPDLKPDDPCIQVLGETWFLEAEIPDDSHKELEIFVNDVSVDTITIQKEIDYHNPGYMDKKGDWELKIYYRAKGTRSEGQHGLLFHKGKWVSADHVGELKETDLGLMKYYGEWGKDVDVLFQPSGWNYSNHLAPNSSDLDKEYSQPK
ncbi:hypothetical protein [Paenibacillus amylolyticus]|uniref:hypothetical protein n=1 Tax=Paenibacillus amylolyticus TaxID=1451 RepID=UPI003D9563BB